MPFDASTAQLVNNQPSQSQSGGFDESTAQLVSPQGNNSGSNEDSDLSSVQPMADAFSSNTPQVQQQAQKSPINFQDMLKMAALNSPQEQQDYLKSKFKFAEPVLDQNGKPTGNFNVGSDPTNLTPIHPGTIGDTALNVLAKGAAMIPAIAGQMEGAEAGAAVGTAVAPGPGTVIGGMLGAGAGAMAGEGAKNLAASTNKGYDPEKAATDNVISGLFGAGGQALGQVIKFGAQNYMAPKIAAAMDGAVQNGKSPAGAAFLSKVLKFTANVDSKESMKGSQIGWKKIYDNHANLNPDEIDNIATDMTNKYLDTQKNITTDFNKAEASLMRSKGTVSTEGILTNLTDRLGNTENGGLGVLTKYEGDGEDNISSFRLNEGNSPDVHGNVLTNFMRKLGATTADGRTFYIPKDANVSVGDAIAAKRMWQGTFNSDNYNDAVGNFVKEALYGSEDEQAGYNGLRQEIFKNAQAEGNQAYIDSNNTLSALFKAKTAVKKVGMDITNPQSVAGYMKNVNKLDAFGNNALNTLHSQIGGDFKDRASQWAVAQAMGKASPQILRLSVVGGLLGLALPGSPAERASRVPMAFALGSPTGAKVMARTAEASGSFASAGSRILSEFAKQAQTPTGTAIISQLLSKKVRR